jgi:N-acetylglutamate synthase-like GNAT family acetyltransferase
MRAAAYQCRRATADDLPQLLLLWHNGGLPAGELEKRFTEFQLVEDADGRIAGVLGFKMEGPHGWLHSETYLDFSLTDTLRPMLWARVKNVAKSYGLWRLWTTESAPFWRQEGFGAATGEALGKLPAVFGPAEARWLTLKLREEFSVEEYLEREMAAFKKAERDRNEQMVGQAKTLKGLATLVAIIALALVIYGGIHLLRNGMIARP